MSDLLLFSLHYGLSCIFTTALLVAILSPLRSRQLVFKMAVCAFVNALPAYTHL